MLRRIIALSIISFVLCFSVIFLMNNPFNKGKGSYEYLRKANILLDKEDFDEAKKQLDLALENSPKSENVQKEVIHGYLLCARELVKKNQIQDGINLLKIALTLRPKNAAVMVHLAGAYIDKSIILFNDKNIDQAKETIDKAMNVGKVSAFLARDISNYMFSKAVDQTNNDNDDTALVLLENSFSLWQRPEAAEFIANISYSLGNSPDAIVYWKKAFDLYDKETDKQRIEEFIVKGTKEHLAREQMKKISSDNFKLSFHSGYDLDTEVIEDIFETVYTDVGKSLDFYPQKGVVVILYKTEDFSNIFQQPDIVKGFYDGTIRLPIDNLQNIDMFRAILAHEYTHALISIITKNNAPIWVNEGIAEYQRNKYFPVDLRALYIYLEQGNKINLIQIDQWFNNGLEDNAYLALAYAASYAAVDFMISRWGISEFKNFLNKINERRHYTNAIDETFFVTIPEFEQMLNDSIENNELLKEEFLQSINS